MRWESIVYKKTEKMLQFFGDWCTINENIFKDIDIHFCLNKQIVLNYSFIKWFTLHPSIGQNVLFKNKNPCESKETMR